MHLMLKLQETHAYTTHEGQGNNRVKEMCEMVQQQDMQKLYQYITHVHCRWNCKLKQKNKLIQRILRNKTEPECSSNDENAN